MPHRYDELVEQLQREIPGFRILPKQDSWMHRFIHRFLIVVTFGKMRDYMSSYYTTIRKTIYVTSDWEERDKDDRYLTLRHEAVHLRQFQRWTTPGMGVLYVLFPLPMGLAWCRAAFEKAAYAETIRATAELRGVDAVRDPRFREDILTEFLGASYGWMWPFRKSMERWYDRVLAELAPPAGAV